MRALIGWLAIGVSHGLGRLVAGLEDRVWDRGHGEYPDGGGGHVCRLPVI
jgi:hypothetical protein